MYMSVLCSCLASHIDCYALIGQCCDSTIVLLMGVSLLTVHTNNNKTWISATLSLYTQFHKKKFIYHYHYSMYAATGGLGV